MIGKKLYERGKQTRLWLILAEVLSLIVLVLIMLQLMGFPVFDQVLSAGVMSGVIILVLCIRYHLFRKEMTWLFAAFLLWTYIGSLKEHVELFHVFDCKIDLHWYMCLLFMAVFYLLEREKQKFWITALMVFYCGFTTCVFIMSIINITLVEIKPGFTGIKYLGHLANGRLSVFGGPNSGGPAAALLILFSLLLIHRFRRSKHRLLLGTVFAIMTCVGFVAISLTRCRSAMVSTAAGLGLFAFILVREHLLQKRVYTRTGSHKDSEEVLPYFREVLSSAKPFLAGFVAFLVVMVLSIVAMLIPKRVYNEALYTYANRQEEISSEIVLADIQVYEITYSLENLTDRTLIWPAVIRTLNDRPERWIFGMTTQHLGDTILGVYTDRPEIPTFSAHNGYLEMLLDYGIPGAAILLVVLILWIITAIRCVFSAKTEVEYKLLTTVCFAVAINAMTESFLFPCTVPFPYSLVFFALIGSIRAVMEDKESSGKKKSTRIFLVFISAAFITALSFAAYSHAKKPRTLPESQMRLEESSAFVRLSDTVTEEMLAPEYWLEKHQALGENVNAPLLTYLEITKYNEDNRRMISTKDVSFALNEIGEQFYVKVAKNLVNDTLFRPSENREYLINGVPVTGDYWKAARKNANTGALKDRISVRFGFSVVREVLKRLPAGDCVYTKEDGRYYDVLAYEELTPFMPVVVLHESADGEWFYVLADSYGGWVRKTSVALCESRDEWLQYMNSEYFLVVTGRELRLPADPYNEILSELSIPMGTVLPIIPFSEAPESINDRVDYGNYICRLVTRNEKGLMEDAYVLIPVAEDVHLGYLEYTESNLVELLFKHLGAAYGWPGDNNSVECSRLLKSVYACFGYNMPRSSQAQANISCSKKLDVSSSSIPEKLKILESAPIGTLLFFDGHSMLYLGMEDGKPYCVSAANSDNIKKEEASSKLYLNTVVLINMTDTLRMDGQSWLEQVETIVIP